MHRCINLVVKASGAELKPLFHTDYLCEDQAIINEQKSLVIPTYTADLGALFGALKLSLPTAASPDQLEVLAAESDHWSTANRFSWVQISSQESMELFNQFTDEETANSDGKRTVMVWGPPPPPNSTQIEIYNRARTAYLSDQFKECMDLLEEIPDDVAFPEADKLNGQCGDGYNFETLRATHQ